MQSRRSLLATLLAPIVGKVAPPPIPIANSGGEFVTPDWIHEFLMRRVSTINEVRDQERLEPIESDLPEFLLTREAFERAALRRQK